MLGEDLLATGAAAEPFKNDLDANAGAANGRLATKNRGVRHDAVEHGYPLALAVKYMRRAVRCGSHVSVILLLPLTLISGRSLCFPRSTVHQGQGRITLNPIVKNPAFHGPKRTGRSDNSSEANID
jgi:hypothetical protein